MNFANFGRESLSALVSDVGFRIGFLSALVSDGFGEKEIVIWTFATGISHAAAFTCLSGPVGVRVRVSNCDILKLGRARSGPAGVRVRVSNCDIRKIGRA